VKKQGSGNRDQESVRAPQVPRSWGPESGVYSSRLIGPAVILLAAAVAVAPQILHGASCGHDFDFHLVSWFDCLNSWRHGILYPHWSASANFGAGEPRFLFYPPLTWMLGAALGAVLHWQLVPLALTFLLLAGTGLATRALARVALPDGPATLAGCVALFSGYALFTTYERSAFGELAGGLWIPLLLFFALRGRNEFRAFCKGRGVDGAPTFGGTFRRAFDGSTVPLALVVAFCWLSNLPLGVMACYLLAATALAAALLSRSWAPVLRAAIASVVGIGLTSIFLLPAIFEQRWVAISQATSFPGEMIENSFLFGRHADPALHDHDVELYRVSLIAVSMLAVGFIGMAIFWMRGRLSARGGKNARPISCHPERNGVESKDLRLLFRNWWLPLALIPFVVLFLQLPISLPVWNLLPKLRFLQFPWRWLVVLEAPMAVFWAAAVWPARRWLRSTVVTLSAMLFVAASAFTARNFYQPCDEMDAVAPMVSVFNTGAGFPGVDEYTPPDADNALLASSLPAACLVDDPSVKLGVIPSDADPDAPIPVWSAEQGTCNATSPWQIDQPEHKRLHAVAPKSGFLILRLRAYPAWRITLNGQPLADLPQRDDGLVAVPVVQGPVDFAADWSTTPDVIAGRWLSALAVLLLTCLWFLERRLRRAHLS